MTKQNKWVNRLKEPSTAAGVAAIAIALGMPAEVAGSAVQVVAGLAGLLAVVLPERKQ